MLIFTVGTQTNLSLLKSIGKTGWVGLNSNRDGRGLLGLIFFAS